MLILDDCTAIAEVTQEQMDKVGKWYKELEARGLVGNSVSVSTICIPWEKVNNGSRSCKHG